MDMTPMARPACCRSTSGLLYLLVVANGRTENDFTRLREVAISSGNASRRKSMLLSNPAFWNGNIAMAVCAAGPPGAGAGRAKREAQQQEPDQQKHDNGCADNGPSLP